MTLGSGSGSAPARPELSVQIPAGALSRLYELLRCIACGAEVTKTASELSCTGCKASYPLLHGVIPSLLKPYHLLSAAEQIELDNLQSQVDLFYSPDWRVGYNVPRVNLIASALPDGVVLDVGGADGQIAHHLTTSARTVVVVEKSVHWLEKYGSVKVPYVLGDIYRLPFAAESVQGVILGEILEHLYDPFEALRRVAAAVAPGGVVTGTVPNFAFALKRARYLLGAFGEGDEALSHAHIRYFTKDNLATLLREAGLKNVVIEPIFRTDFGTGIWARGLNRLQSSLAQLSPSFFGVTFFFAAEKP